MLKSFLKFLGGLPGEEKQMTLLLGKGFFMGILLATYQIGAETLFLTVLGEKWLDTAFFATGAAGILSATLFVYLQRKINFSSLVISATFIIAIFITVLRFAFQFIGYDSNAGGVFQILPFVLFVMVGPVTAITLLGFWGVFGRVFNLRQSKRIIGGIDTGQLLATMFAFFSIPLMTSIGLINQTYDLLILSSIASFGVFTFTVLISMRYNLDKVTKVMKGDKVADVNFLSLFKDKYLRLLSIFLIFSMSASVFLDYTFLSATEIIFTDEQELSTFLSFFSGMVIIFSFLIQSFLNDLIIGKFGLKVALMVMPLVLILFTLAAIVVGFIFEYEVKTDEYILFFVLIGTGKLFTASLKDALENPAFKLFFLPIDVKIRFDIQTRIEGIVNEIAVFFAGAVQIALGLLSFFEIIHYSFFVVFLSVGVVYLAIRLYEEYKKTLKSTLESKKVGLKGHGKRNENNMFNTLKKEIRTKNRDRIFNALKLLEKLEPIEYEYILLDLLNHKIPEVRLYAYRKLGDMLSWETFDILKKDIKTEGEERVLEVAGKTYKKLEEANNFVLTDVNIKSLVRSTDYEQRIKGAKFLSGASQDRHVNYLVELLRDINPEVRSAAMITAGKLRRAELWPVLIENLHLVNYGNVATSSLISSGEAVFTTMDMAFYKTGQYHTTMVRIIQILTRIGGKDAIDLLWKKIDFPDRKIVSQLLLSLSYLGFSARDFQKSRIKIAIENEVGEIAWNIKSTLEIPDGEYIDEMVKQALKEEDKKNYDDIFMLLSMIYDPQSVLLTKENIQDETSESITFAVEMMSIYLDEDLKDKLIPVMDDLKVGERLTKLQDFYPPESFEGYKDLLLQIINRDYNKLNRYTKALAIFRYGQISNTVPPDIVANLFNPDPLLLQTAAYVIYKIDRVAYHESTKRLKPIVKKELDKAILPPVFSQEDEDYHQRQLLIERILILKEIKDFKNIPGEVIANISERLEEEVIPTGTTIVREGDSGMKPVYIVVDGMVDIFEGDEKTDELGRGGVFGQRNLTESDTFEFSAVARGKVTVLVLKKEELFSLMMSHIEIVDCWIGLLNRIKEPESSAEVVSVLFE